ncbi:hypothetical protein V7S43_017892 [Phytophthora oleae]|uniref:Uncharacterized protein n=1 Tax=Phytophthora oleae TaxID=2107226 RepID=A0ABD3EU77_9STRA
MARGGMTGRTPPAELVRTRKSGTAAKIRAKKAARATARAALVNKKRAKAVETTDPTPVARGDDVTGAEDEGLEPGEIRPDAVPSSTDTPSGVPGITVSNSTVPHAGTTQAAPGSTPTLTNSSHVAPDSTSTNSTRVPRGSPATNNSRRAKVYYRIYRKNYGQQRVTVRPDYATTRKTWMVARIIDRRFTPRGYEFRVL